MRYVCTIMRTFIACSGFLDDEFTIDPIGDTHFNGSQDNGPLSGDHWETELMGAKTTSGTYVHTCMYVCAVLLYLSIYYLYTICVCMCEYTCICVCILTVESCFIQF